MNTIVTILLLSLFSAFFTGFLTGSNMLESSVLSIDKLIKLAVFALAFMILLFQRKKLYITKHLWIYILPGGIFLLCLLAHWLYLSESDDFSTFRATREIVRLAIVLVVFVLCAAVSSKTMDYRILVYSFAIAGILVGLLSFWHTITGESEHSLLYVEGYLRAGTGITDVNMVGAFLNVISVASLIGYLIQNRRLSKIFFLSTLIVAQGARFATFSTGGFLSFVITVIAAIYLIKKYHTRMLKPFLKMTVFVAFVFVILIWRTGLFTTVFYRVLFSDDTVKRASIDSRLNQYSKYTDLIREEPAVLFWGTGATGLHRLLGRDLHNSYLRPLAAGGVVAFGCFMFLWWHCLRDFIFSIKTSRDNEVHSLVSIFFFAGFIGWSFQAATIPADTSTIQWFFFIIAYLLRRSASTLSTDRVLRQQQPFKSVHIYDLNYALIASNKEVV